MNLTKIILTLAFIMQNLAAENLSHFRGESRAKLEATALQQIDLIRHYTHISSPRPPTELLDLAEVKPHKAFSSSTIREFVDKVVKEIYETRRWGELIASDPSKFESEKSEDQKDADRKVLIKLIGNDFSKLLKQADLDSKQRADTDVIVDPREARVLSLLENYIFRNQPLVDPQRERSLDLSLAAKLQDKMGSLRSIDILGGVPTRLIFEGSNIRSFITIGSLISVRNGTDFIFVKTLELIVEKIQTESEKFFDKETGKRKKLNEAQEREFSLLESGQRYFQQRLTGARSNNQILSSLTRSQLDYLIDALIQLRGVDLPLAEELPELSVKFFNSYNPLEVAYLEAAKAASDTPSLATRRKLEEAEAALSQKQSEKDAYLFYVELEGQLSNYRQVLEDEARAAKVVAPIVERIKAEKSQ